MENPSHVEGAISLHLYVPAYSECHTFDQRTGVKQNGWFFAHLKKKK